MKRFLLAFSLFLTLVCFSQAGDKPLKATNDSVINESIQSNDTMADPDPFRVQGNFDSNMDYLLRLQKEQKAKQKKAAIIRIAIGLAMLVVLFIGLRRRKGPSRSL